jgi:hypothetical protein
LFTSPYEASGIRGFFGIKILDTTGKSIPASDYLEIVNSMMSGKLNTYQIFPFLVKDLKYSSTSTTTPTQIKNQDSKLKYLDYIKTKFDFESLRNMIHKNGIYFYKFCLFF